MNKIINFISNHLDKVCHWSITIIIVMVCTKLLYTYTNNIPFINADTAGMLVGILANIVKEVFDYIRKNQFEINDILFGTLGAITGFLLSFIYLL